MRWLESEKIEQRVFQTNSFACVVGKVVGAGGLLLLTLLPSTFLSGGLPYLEGPTAIQAASLMAVGLLAACMSVITLMAPAKTDLADED